MLLMRGWKLLLWGEAALWRVLGSVALTPKDFKGQDANAVITYMRVKRVGSAS